MPRRAPGCHFVACSVLACCGLLGAGLPWLVPAAQAQVLADPRVAWQTADSAHFRVHYRESQRAQAEAVALAAERVYPRVTQGLGWEPRGRTEIVLYSEFDIPNGFTTPLPYNKIGVFLAPPDAGALLDNSDWLDLLLVHEFTHAVHLDKVRGAPRVLQAIFGRVPWFMPNLFQPGWATEGIATLNESDPASGRGRLRGPVFEGWLRAERSAGFLSLRELNADGRALPLSKQYLYGAYFYDFLARRYGADKPAAVIDQYSGNLVPRLHSAPAAATGKTMDLLWDEFLADLAQQVDQRAAPLRQQSEVLGPRLVGPLFDIPSVATLPGGDLLAVLDDGLGATQLTRLRADGAHERLATVNGEARLDVAADGRVLLTQYDVCDTLYLSYDVYRLEAGGLQQLTRCAHLRRAVQAGADILALQLQAGRTRLVQLGAAGAEPQPIYTPAAGVDLIDLAASPDGQRVSLIEKQGGEWRLVQIDRAQPAAMPRLLLRRATPLSALREGRAGLEFIMADGDALNVWRLQGGQLQRLTHSHTGVLAHSGTAADGGLATVVLAPQGHALHRLDSPATLQAIPSGTTADARASAPSAPSAAEATTTPMLTPGERYAAWRALHPRAWLPAITTDRGLTAYGASITGADALGWHQYAATLQWETSQKELLGTLEYVFVDSHGLTLKRRLKARAWTGDGEETTTVYDRDTQLQWLSTLPITRLQRRITLGLGAAMDRSERVDLQARRSTRRHDERVLAALADWDSRGGNWYAEGPNRGLKATLLFEAYKPLARADTPYDGTVLRADLRGHVPLGRSVLALRWTEVRAGGSTEPFQLGGATDEALQLGPVLNHRELALRGYRGDEAVLRGRHARVASVEWRTPLADIDRHAMVPPLGINRLSATLFADFGGAWDEGRSPPRYHRGVGVELLGEVKLLYALGLQLRLGVARGLDAPRGTRGYLSLGRAF